jgi:hypothetical protein
MIRTSARRMTKIGCTSEGYLAGVPTNRLPADHPGTRYGVSMISCGLVAPASRGSLLQRNPEA